MYQGICDAALKQEQSSRSLAAVQVAFSRSLHANNCAQVLVS